MEVKVTRTDLAARRILFMICTISLCGSDEKNAAEAPVAYGDDGELLDAVEDGLLVDIGEDAVAPGVDKMGLLCR